MRNSKLIINVSLYFLCVMSLFVGLYFGENSSGGAKHDYYVLEKYYYSFSVDIIRGLELFLSNDSSKIHSPIFYILVGLVLRVINNIDIVKVIYVISSSIIPYIFYKIILLKNLIRNDNDNIYFFISLLIFLSPYFRSSAIWLLGDNLSILFFSLFVFFVIKIQLEKKILKNYFFSCIFLILCCYIRYYYCLYYLVIVYFSVRYLSVKQNFYILLVSLILSSPFFIYILSILLNNNFYIVLKNFSNNPESLFFYNYVNNVVQIYLIVLIYMVPFVMPKLKNLISYYLSNFKLLIVVIVAFILLLILNYIVNSSFFLIPQLGGGIFFKFLSLNLFHGINFFLFFLFLFVSILFLDFIFKDNRILNYFIFFILILSLPMTVLYQKYLDPLIYFFLFGLVNTSIINEVKINKYFLILYFMGVLIVANLYYMY
jgi:hypothetical protein